jgi:hypothetical protein
MTMGNVLTWQDVVKQSTQVYGQFGESKWIPYAKKNVELPRKNTSELQNSGIGKFLLLCAMGESLEENIDVIKKYRDRVDICTCDKGFGLLYDHGIIADYVMVCDCNILFEHIENHIDKTDKVKLLATPYANPTYTKMWGGDRYFFINQDAIQSEKKFIEIFGKDIRIIPAGSNVSNAMLGFFTGSDEYQNINWGGYEKYILIGYDYSWRPDGNYYAWKNPKPKRYYMNHRTMLDFKGEMIFSSENLFFSAKWLYSYVSSFKLPVINCSERGLLYLGEEQNKPLESVLSSINSDKISMYDYRESFDNLKIATINYQNSQRLFEKTRRYLYGSRV